MTYLITEQDLGRHNYDPQSKLHQMKNPYTTTSERWEALETRNRQADGYFFYGVKSTGIYCRPSCSSRKPKRENTEFFASILKAKKAGYRACKKCQPESLSRELVLAKRICNIIDTNIDEPLSLLTLSKKINLSPSHLQRLFKRSFGMSPRQYQELGRIHRFKSELAKRKKITNAIYDAGFESSSNAYSKIKNYLGMRPSAYQRQGAGTHIIFTTFNTSIGKILIAKTEQGICRIDIGTNTRTLIANLHKEFAQATIHRDDKKLNRYAEKIIVYLNHPHQGFDFQVDLWGNTLQKKVWAVLRTIPYGETRSYTEIAEAIGTPKAVRAVASAIANNCIALAIPCHRVIRKNGELSDYRWGNSRKRWLLEHERRTKK